MPPFNSHLVFLACSRSVVSCWEKPLCWIATADGSECAESTLLSWGLLIAHFVCGRIELSKEKFMTTRSAPATVYPETDGMPLPDGEYQAPAVCQNRGDAQDSLQGHSGRKGEWRHVHLLRRG